MRYARRDLSSVDLVDPRTGKFLASLLPFDEEKNADGRRSSLEPVVTRLEPTPAAGVASLLQQPMTDYAATGLPPAFLPRHREASAPAPSDTIPSSSTDEDSTAR